MRKGSRRKRRRGQWLKKAERASEYHFSPLENSPKVWPNSRLIVDRRSKKEHSANCAIYIRLLSPIDNNQEPYDDDRPRDVLKSAIHCRAIAALFWGGFAFRRSWPVGQKGRKRSAAAN